MFPSVFGQNSGEVILLNEKHKRKLRRFAAVCAVTAFAVLAIFSALYFARVKDYRCASRYSYERSFEETAAAVGALSDTLEKSRYATGQLCHALASEAFAEACAAKAALATLPFSTVEMEQTKSFLGTVGDFTHALCSRDGEFTDDERADVLALSDAASAYSALLLDMKDALSCGELTMDSREKQLVNVLPDPDERHLSDGFADAEENFPTLRELKSVSGVATAPQPQYLDPARARAAAATFLNVSEDLLREEYSYADGTIAFSRGTVTLRADEEHVISLSDSRLVDMVNVSDKQENAIWSEARLKPFEKDRPYTLHMEFMLSFMPNATGQARSNSGVYLQEEYECQVLDSFGLEGENNECAGFYQQLKPIVNACFPPLTWQTYDFDVTPAKFNDKGEKIANAVITVKHNGILVHDKAELAHETPGGKTEKTEAGEARGVFLQGHGNKVQYRNIWIKYND